MHRRSFLAGTLGTLGATVVAVGAPSSSPTANAATTPTTLVVIVYRSGTYPARPPGTVAGGARYIGPTQPASWLVGDEWIQITS